MLAAIATYLSSAVFHDLTLLPQQQWLLFMLAGLTLNLRLSPQFASLGPPSKARLSSAHRQSFAAAPPRPGTA